MSKHFIISKEVVEGVVLSEEGFRIEFCRDTKVVDFEGGEVYFKDLNSYIETLQALAWALREDIEEAIEEEQDNSLPDIVGDDTDHIG